MANWIDAAAAAFCVDTEEHGLLQSFQTATKFGIVKDKVDVIKASVERQQLYQTRVKLIVDGIKNFEVMLKINESLKRPMAQTHQCMSFHLEKKMENEFLLDIIERTELPNPLGVINLAAVEV